MAMMLVPEQTPVEPEFPRLDNKICMTVKKILTSSGLVEPHFFWQCSELTVYLVSGQDGVSDLE